MPLHMFGTCYFQESLKAVRGEFQNVLPDNDLRFHRTCFPQLHAELEALRFSKRARAHAHRNNETPAGSAQLNALWFIVL